MPEILSQSSAEAWYALESNFILVCCCFHLRHAKNVLFIPSKCLLKAYSTNEVLSVVEMRLLMPVHIMELCAASGTPWCVTCFYGGLLVNSQLKGSGLLSLAYNKT